MLVNVWPLQIKHVPYALNHVACKAVVLMPQRPPLVPIVVPPPAPDSPRSAQSVPPTGIQGDLEQDLMGLANALYNLGTTVVNDSTKDPGTGKQVGLRVCVHALQLSPKSYVTWGRNEVVGHLAGLDDMASHLTTRIPMQILTDIDNGRNPMHLTKERLERTATENQFMNGKIKAIEVCHDFPRFRDALTASGLESRAIGSCWMRRWSRRFLTLQR